MFTVIHIKAGFSGFGMRGKRKVLYHLLENHGEIYDRITKKIPNTKPKKEKKRKKGKKGPKGNKGNLYGFCVVKVQQVYHSSC